MINEKLQNKIKSKGERKMTHLDGIVEIPLKDFQNFVAHRIRKSSGDKIMVGKPKFNKKRQTIEVHVSQTYDEHYVEPQKTP